MNDEELRERNRVAGLKSYRRRMKDPGWREYRRQYAAALRAKPEKRVRHLLSGAKIRARKRGEEFAISAEELAIPTHCPVLGIELNYGAAVDGPQADNRPSLDRVDNTKGYVSGNVRVISLRANSIKRNSTAEELRRIADYMDRHNDLQEILG